MGVDNDDDDADRRPAAGRNCASVDIWGEIAKSPGDAETPAGSGDRKALVAVGAAAMLVAAVTGAAWYWTQGSAEALDWRARHIVAARCLFGLLVAHIVAASLHVLDFIGD